MTASASPLAADDPRHGTVNGYTNLRCRCPQCREAQRVYSLNYIHRTGRHRPRAEHVAAVRAAAEARDNHGTETRYKLGCRCDACKTAQNAARNRRRKKPNVAVHGRHSSYSNGCRCDACRAANTAYMRERRKAKAA